MKDKKFEIFMIGFIVFLSLIIVGIILIVKIYNKKNSYVLFTKPFNILECVRYKCSTVKDIVKYNNKDYNVYLNGEYLGVNKLFYNEVNKKYYVFNQDNKNIYNNDDDTPESPQLLIGTSGNVKVTSKIIDIERMTKDDYDILSDLIGKDIEYIDEVPINKYVADFDGDGEKETLYAYSFVANYRAYNFLAYTNNGKTKLIEYNSFDNSTKYETVTLHDVIDIYDDGKLEFLVTKTYENEFCTELYRLRGNKFVSGGKCAKNEE